MVSAAATITVGPGIWTHIIGDAPISQITGDPPFQWLAFGADQTMTHSANLVLPNAKTGGHSNRRCGLLPNDGTTSGVWLCKSSRAEGADGPHRRRYLPALATLMIPADGVSSTLAVGDGDMTALARCRRLSLPCAVYRLRRPSSFIARRSSGPNSDDYRLCTERDRGFRVAQSWDLARGIRSGPTRASRQTQGKLSTTADEWIPARPSRDGDYRLSRYRALAEVHPLGRNISARPGRPQSQQRSITRQRSGPVSHVRARGRRHCATDQFRRGAAKRDLRRPPSTMSSSPCQPPVVLTRGGAAVNGTAGRTSTPCTTSSSCPDVRGATPLIALDNLRRISRKPWFTGAARSARTKPHSDDADESRHWRCTRPRRGAEVSGSINRRETR